MVEKLSLFVECLSTQGDKTRTIGLLDLQFIIVFFLSFVPRAEFDLMVVDPREASSFVLSRLRGNRNRSVPKDLSSAGLGSSVGPRFYHSVRLCFFRKCLY